jgi:ribulose-phosphate 3-epimerase
MRRVVICPTITAYDTDEYRQQINNVKGFAKRIHIDLMDGEFASTKSPALHEVWWPHELKADIHLMYQRPMEHLEQLIRLKPRMVIVHNEAHVHHMHFAAELHKHDIKAGLAVLAETPIEWAEQIMHSFDQVLVFSGHLGYHGGQADLGLLDKVKFAKHHHPEVEIAWDGGISDHNARALVDAGVTVLNVGGFIQKTANPKDAYAKLVSVIGADKREA